MTNRAGNNRASRSKYRNVRFQTKDGWFDSKAEWNRWIYLKHQEKVGSITGLEKQVEFSLDIGEAHVCCYVADFVYTRLGKQIVEDVKGKIITDTFILKKKLMKILLGIEVMIVKSPTEGDFRLSRVDDPKNTRHNGMRVEHDEDQSRPAL